MDFMTIQIAAIFENGAFRAAAPVMLQEGAHVLLSIEPEEPLRPPGPLVAVLARIVAMPAQSADDGFSGADHDKLLYSQEGTYVPLQNCVLLDSGSRCPVRRPSG